MRRRVAILGCTGSIGRQAIDVARTHPDRFEVAGLVANSNGDALRALAQEFPGARTGLGSRAAARIAALDDVDVVLNAVVGAAGLGASLAALESGKTLALANKESLVAAGELCTSVARRCGGSIVPVDSEHAAIAQCIRGCDGASIARIVLTASGGPFRGWRDLSSIRPADALAHPTWTMGAKITVDCATMMNKGLEVIEAHHLFGLDYDRIDVVVHPQSVVHGIVELVDGSMLMQAAVADMRIPIQAALDSPHRFPCAAGRVDLDAVGTLEFEPLDALRFPAVELAYGAGRAGRCYPAVLNAANEVAVQAFLREELSFVDIVVVVESVLGAHQGTDANDLQDVLEVDRWARSEAARRIARGPTAISIGVGSQRVSAPDGGAEH
jgi:1-deoxy-D-xylulose-5-phosphate reductoisomerase